MSKSTRKARVPNEPPIHYVPSAIRESDSYGPLIQKYDEFIEMFDGSSDDSEASYTRHTDHSSSQFNNEDSNKCELKTLHELKCPSKPIIHCYNASRDNIGNPVTVKKSFPIKKISFVLPDGKKPEDEERMDWKDYHRLEVIYNFMDELEADFPSICTTASIGMSVEGRHLKILKISNSNANNVAVWMDAGIHAREWIAPAVNTYIANHISRNFESLPDSVTNKDWYFLPVANPDGYHYSHTTDRLWRKSRAFHNGERCGVDLNRNFGVGWGGKGSSDKPSNSFYRGPYAFSEPESAAMRDVFLKSGINFKVYITLHSYGQIIIFPYSCTPEMAPDYVQLLEGATVMSKAIYKTHGETYKVGISRDVMYASAGTSSDFAHGAAGIPYCYLIELRSKQHRFKLPKDQIEETGQEILNSVLALMEFVDNYRYPTASDEVLETQLMKNESVLDNCSIIRSAKAYVKQFESYDKNSFLQKCNSQKSNQGSYVKLSSIPRNSFLEDTSDAGWSESFIDGYPISRHQKVISTNTSEKETEPYQKHCSNDLATGKIKLVHYDAFTKTDSGTYDSSDNLFESQTESDNSYEARTKFYMKKNHFHEIRSDLLNTGAYGAEYIQR